ncbi:hypothetical protein AWB79_07507 [Caballeronia hypogeia]|uniref:Uncharacterized protein n=1 Tax=Caballeronia hypogeia TaxID=1777140 RepID=A0A158DST6_9BURK|nr:hypothetical protein [Caballeronia hypogeia]SAK97719.1 hypothetical protein AWB79_07507 [Caballeronia hypogeia]
MTVAAQVVRHCLDLSWLQPCDYAPGGPSTVYLTLGDALAAIALILAFTQLSSPTMRLRFALRRSRVRYVVALVTLSFVFTVFAVFAALLQRSLAALHLPLIAWPVWWELLAAICFAACVVLLALAYFRPLSYSRGTAKDFNAVVSMWVARGDRDLLRGLAVELESCFGAVVAAKKNPYAAETFRILSDRALLAELIDYGGFAIREFASKLPLVDKYAGGKRERAKVYHLITGNLSRSEVRELAEARWNFSVELIEALSAKITDFEVLEDAYPRVEFKPPHINALVQALFSSAAVWSRLPENWRENLSPLAESDIEKALRAAAVITAMDQMVKDDDHDWLTSDSCPQIKNTIWALATTFQCCFDDALAQSRSRWQSREDLRSFTRSIEPCWAMTRVALNILGSYGYPVSMQYVIDKVPREIVASLIHGIVPYQSDTDALILLIRALQPLSESAALGLDRPDKFETVAGPGLEWHSGRRVIFLWGLLRDSLWPLMQAGSGFVIREMIREGASALTEHPKAAEIPFLECGMTVRYHEPSGILFLSQGYRGRETAELKVNPPHPVDSCNSPPSDGQQA